MILNSARLDDGWAIGEWLERAFVPLNSKRYTIDDIGGALDGARFALTEREYDFRQAQERHRLSYGMAPEISQPQATVESAKRSAPGDLAVQHLIDRLNELHRIVGQHPFEIAAAESRGAKMTIARAKEAVERLSQYLVVGANGGHVSAGAVLALLDEEARL